MKWRVLRVLLMLIVIFLFGTFSFSKTESISFFDAAYWTVITCTTVGYGDITPQTPLGKLVSIILVTCGLGIYGYAAASLGGLLIEGRVKSTLEEVFGLKKYEKRRHVVIIGWNPIAEEAANELTANGYDVVVVDESGEHVHEIRERGAVAVKGDALRETTLRNANAQDAAHVLIALNDDSRTIMAVLLCKRLTSARVVACINSREHVELARHAGADEVVSAATFGGRLLASAAFEPSVAKFLNDVSTAAFGYDVAELSAADAVIGKTLAAFKEATGALVLAIRRGDKLLMNPPLDTKIEKGDILVVLGSREELERARTWQPP